MEKKLNRKKLQQITFKNPKKPNKTSNPTARFKILQWLLKKN